MSSLPLPSLPDPGPQRIAVHRRIQPSPAVDLSRMIRYRGGTYSHTVDTIVFTDGTSARTDLIRLNPNIDAYSLDFAGIAPGRPSRYAADTWAAVPHLQARAHEVEVDWILRNSYPILSTTTLSARLRAAGYPLGGRNISDHEAIAGTQAAIWNLTNGLELDDRPLDVPVRVDTEQRCITVDFDGERQLGGYTANVISANGAVLTLQKDLGGDAWESVAASSVSVPPGGGRVTRSLGVGSTVWHSRPGGRGGGHQRYRLVVDGEATVGEFSFELHGSKRFRNSEFVVYLYNYLLAGARAARASAVSPALAVDSATVSDGLVGPLRLKTTDAATVTAADGTVLVRGADSGDCMLLQPHEEFFLRANPGGDSTTLTVEVPGEPGGFGGRVLTGVVRDEVDGRFTPLALAVPTQLVVEFDVDWTAV
jgi:TQXA domain-containing protein